MSFEYSGVILRVMGFYLTGSPEWGIDYKHRVQLY